MSGSADSAGNRGSAAASGSVAASEATPESPRDQSSRESPSIGSSGRIRQSVPSASGLSPVEVVEALGREFFAALDARDPRRLRHTMAANATFRAHPHSAPIRPADEIVAYFGTVVSSYPNAHWDVTDVIATPDRGAVQFVIREYSARQGRELISEQVAIIRISQGKIVSMVGYYDSAEFQRVFWEGE
jgi:ketosteroid isomerase-like protein